MDAMFVTRTLASKAYNIGILAFCAWVVVSFILDNFSFKKISTRKLGNFGKCVFSVNSTKFASFCQKFYKILI